MYGTPAFAQGHYMLYAKPLNTPVCTEEEMKMEDKWLLTFSETEDSRAA